MMQPYQKAAEESKRQKMQTGQFLGNIALGSVGIGLTGGFGKNIASSMIPKIKSFLNEYIPEDLAKKGMEKLNPKIGEFIKHGMGFGYTYDQMKEFLGDKIGREEENIQAKESRNIIEQESPELHQFILDQIKQGRKPLEAGAIATLNRSGQPSFSKAIDKLTKTHKIPWSKIIESVYGLGETVQQQQDQQKQNIQQPGAINEQLAQILQVGNQLMQRYKPNG